MLTNIKQAKKCNPGKFKRMSYFHGMLLTEQDLLEEQTYFRDKLKLHNRFHGEGVVWGLCLKRDKINPQSGDAIYKIFIEPGVALDCAGNEIIVCQDYQVPLDEKIQELITFGHIKIHSQVNNSLNHTAKESGACSSPLPKLYIGIKYCECKSQPAEQMTSECGDDQLYPQFSRVREGFDVIVLSEEEYRDYICSSNTTHTQNCNCGCSAIPTCTENDLIIFPGYVEGYDTSDKDPNHSQANITYIAPLIEPVKKVNSIKNWENHKLKMLNTVFKDKKDWLDLSCFIGKSIEYFYNRLEELEIELETVEHFPPYNDPDKCEPHIFRELVQYALPWASQDPGDIVHIIADHKNCITFILIKPEQPECEY